MIRGRFLTFEGGEGVGKTTQAERLQATLAAQGIDVLLTREPGGAPGAEAIREVLVRGKTGRWEPLSEALLHYAARHEHVQGTIRPALDAGRWVICDRFADSTMAYQGAAQGLGRDIVLRLQAIVLGDFSPDLTLILDLPPETGLAREQATDEARYAAFGTEFHQRVRAGFLDIARAEPARCAVVDARGSASEVGARIAAVVAERLGVAADG